MIRARCIREAGTSFGEPANPRIIRDSFEEHEESEPDSVDIGNTIFKKASGANFI